MNWRLFTSCAVLVIAGNLLSGCLPGGTDSQDQVLSDQQLELSSSNTDDPTGITVLEKEAMNKKEKTLKDFKEIEATQAIIETDKGTITVELFRDKAPLTTANFVNLVSDKFYDGIVFHRVIPDFMAQVGDPLTKESSEKQLWGTGGPGYTIADEFDPSLKHDAAGVLSMANAGPNTGGSQFFITYEATPWLDGKHAVFGKVTSGMDVLKKITQGDSIKTITLK